MLLHEGCIFDHGLAVYLTRVIGCVLFAVKDYEMLAAVHELQGLTLKATDSLSNHTGPEEL